MVTKTLNPCMKNVTANTLLFNQCRPRHAAFSQRKPLCECASKPIGRQNSCMKRGFRTFVHFFLCESVSNRATVESADVPRVTQLGVLLENASRVPSAPNPHFRAGCRNAQKETWNTLQMNKRAHRIRSFAKTNASQQTAVEMTRLQTRKVSFRSPAVWRVST